MSRWHRPQDRLPRIGEAVLCQVASDAFAVLALHNTAGGSRWGVVTPVQAVAIPMEVQLWCRLPKPPKDGGA